MIFFVRNMPYFYSCILNNAISRLNQSKWNKLESPHPNITAAGMNMKMKNRSSRYVALIYVLTVHGKI